MTRRTYRNPPIEEALVELRFAAETDVTLAGRLHERLHAQYPGNPIEQRLISATLRPNEDDPNTGSLGIGEQGTRVLLRTENHRRLIGVGPNVLSVHNLKPYGGWEEDFRPRILEAVEVFASLVQDPAVVRVGLRYINHIGLAGDRVDLDEYFAVGFEMPDNVVPAVNKFFVRLESEFEHQVRLATTFASTDAPPGSSAFLLDLDLSAERSGFPMELGEALTVMDDLRERERGAFEAMIKDPLRTSFDA